MYKRQNYKKILEDITVSRETAEREADARSEALCAVNDELRAIDTELKSTGMKLFKLACLGQDITPLKERNQFLCAERKRIIVSLGYPEDYTEPKYSWTVCNDTGFSGVNMCTCMRRELIKRGYQNSGIGGLVDTQSFDTFSLIYYTEGEQRDYMASVLRACRDYAENFNVATSGNVLFIGGTGLGKTHLSTSIARVVIEKGNNVVYESAQNIFSDFETEHFSSKYAHPRLTSS